MFGDWDLSEGGQSVGVCLCSLCTNNSQLMLSWKIIMKSQPASSSSWWIRVTRQAEHALWLCGFFYLSAALTLWCNCLRHQTGHQLCVRWCTQTGAASGSDWLRSGHELFWRPKHVTESPNRCLFEYFLQRSFPALQNPPAQILTRTMTKHLKQHSVSKKVRAVLNYCWALLGLS